MQDNPVPSSRGTSIFTNQPNPGNGLAFDAYQYLFPQIIQQDQDAAIEYFTSFWDSPSTNQPQAWDTAGATWDQKGKFPFIQNLFYVIEQLQLETLQSLATLATITHPDESPASLLSYMAEQCGGSIDPNTSDLLQRAAIRAFSRINQVSGTDAALKAVFRAIGLDSEVYELYKQQINQSRLETPNYSRQRYVTQAISGESVGSSGSSSYVGKLSGGRTKPGSVVFKESGGETWRDLKNGLLVGNNNGYGTIDYATGEYILQAISPTSGAVTVDYSVVIEYYPYQAARIDFDVHLEQEESPAEATPSLSNIPTSERVVTTVVTPSTASAYRERAESVIPIHVLLRFLGLVLIHHDYLYGFVGEPECCGPLELVDDRRLESSPSYRRYFGEYPIAAYEGLDIYQDASGSGISGPGVGVGTTDVDKLLEDDVFVVSPIADTLYITAGSDEYWR